MRKAVKCFVAAQPVAYKCTEEVPFFVGQKGFPDKLDPYKLTRYAFTEESEVESESICHFTGEVEVDGMPALLDGRGNGPINAACQALNAIGLSEYAFLNYHEHAISSGSDSKAIAYIQVQAPDGRKWFGVGTSHNINVASVRGILCAINRAIHSEK
jgi:2-isopropylmalate synthase